MPGTPATTPRLAIPRYASTDSADFPTQWNAGIDQLDIVAGRFESGLLAARPSTGAGIANRYYFATDDTSGGPSGTLYRDSGGATPTWVRVNPANAEAAFSTWKMHALGASLPGSGIVTAGGPYFMPVGNGGPAVLGAAGTGSYSFYFDPADYVAGSRQTKLRIRWQFVVGTVAPGVTIAPVLYPVTSYAAASGVQLSISAVGTGIAGSGVTFTTPGAGTNTATLSTEFNAPVAGDYVFGFTTSGGFAAGSQCALRAQLQVRQV